MTRLHHEKSVAATGPSDLFLRDVAWCLPSLRLGTAPAGLLFRDKGGSWWQYRSFGPRRLVTGAAVPDRGDVDDLKSTPEIFPPPQKCGGKISGRARVSRLWARPAENFLVEIFYIKFSKIRKFLKIFKFLGFARANFKNF